MDPLNLLTREDGCPGYEKEKILIRKLMLLQTYNQVFKSTVGRFLNLTFYLLQ